MNKKLKITEFIQNINLYYHFLSIKHILAEKSIDFFQKLLNSSLVYIVTKDFYFKYAVFSTFYSSKKKMP